MNYNVSMKSYIDTEIQTKTLDSNPHSIIKEVLIELKKNMETLAYSIDNEPIISSIKSNAFSKSLTAIYILQSSLDFEKGGDIAQNLFDLYDYCKRGINKNLKLFFMILLI